MDDLISRQAAIDAFDNVDWYHQDRNKGMVLGANPPEHQAWYKEGDIYKAIENVPTIEERKTGRWIDPTPENGMIYDKKAYAECSVCGKKEYLGRGKNYCPNCGSRMVRGEEHEGL